MLSYVIANCICLSGKGRFPASRILRRLRTLEKRGEVVCLGMTGNNYEWELPRDR